MRRLNPEQLKKSILAQNPTGEQRDAIFSEKSEFLLRACPGSGKTWTTCRRFLWRTADWNYDSGGLAMLSFTNTAVKEFKLATAAVGRGALEEPHFVGTLDAFIERFVMGPFGHLITDGKKRPRLFVGPRPGDLNNSNLNVKVQITGGRWIPIPAWKLHPKLVDGKTTISGKAQYQDVTVNTDAGLKAINTLFRRGEYAHHHRGFWACHLLRKLPKIGKIIAQRFPELTGC